MLHPRDRGIGAGQIRIQFDGLLSVGLGLGHRLLWLGKIVDRQQAKGICQADIRIGVVRIEFDGFFKVRDGVVEALLAALVPFAATGLVLGLGLGVFGGFLGRVAGFRQHPNLL